MSELSFTRHIVHYTDSSDLRVAQVQGQGMGDGGEGGGHLFYIGAGPKSSLS